MSDEQTGRTPEQAARDESIARRLAQQWAQMRDERRTPPPPAPVLAGPSNFTRAQVPFGVDLAASWAWRFIVIVIAGGMIAYAVGFLSVITLPLVIALFVAALAQPVVDLLERVGLRRSVGAILVVIGGVALVGGLLTFAGQQVATGATDLADQTVQGLDEIKTWLKDGPLKASDSQINGYIEQAQQTITEQSGEGGVVTRVTEVGTAVGHVFAGFFIVLFATYFFLADGQRIWSFMVRIAPRAARSRVDGSGRVAWISLTQFVRATVIVAAVDAIGIMIVAAILQVPFVFAIGVLIFIGAFIPLVGATVTGSVAVLVALVDQGPITALLMLGGVILVQQIEAHILQPFLMGRWVSVHPLAVIIGIGCGVLIAGVAGALVAVPLVAAGNAVVQHLAASTEVGDDDPVEDLQADYEATGEHPVLPQRDDPEGDRVIDPTAGVTLADIRAAREVLRGITIETPMEESRWLSSLAGGRVSLKCENLQRTGSFKSRGAYVRISRLSPEERSRGVVAASAGNHAQGVALSAQLLGIRSTVFMPEGAPIPKERATRGYGAQVVFEGRYLEDSLVAARAFAAETGAILIHPFDHLDIVAGQGTAGLEILEQAPDDLRTVLVPTGGGGLLAGVAIAIKALRPDVRVIGVQAEGAAAFPASLTQGRPVPLTSMKTMADGIAVGLPGEITFAAVRDHVDEVVTVSEDLLSRALLALVERAKLVVEPAGAAAVAAIMASPDSFDTPAVAVLSGGNIDPLLLGKVIRHGMAAAGRYLNLRVTIPDTPGGLAQLLAEVGGAGANVLEVVHERISPSLHLDEVEVQLQLETRGEEHTQQVIGILTERGFRVLG